jgi:osmotically-inducible protein OsmY
MLSLRYKSLSKNYFKFLIFLVLSITTSSCSNIISATRDTPINENYGKRTAGAAIDDQWIETKAKVNLKKIDKRFKKAQISIKSFNGVVLITGNVPQKDLRDIAKNTIQKIRKVRIVHNHLNVTPPRASIARFSDVILKRKVKLRYLLEKNVPQKRVEVVVNDGVIFLMGLVTQSEAEIIIKETEKSYGLQKIVKVFEFIN